MIEACPACNEPIDGEPEHCPHCDISLYHEPLLDEAEEEKEEEAAEGNGEASPPTTEEREEFQNLVNIYRGEMTDVMALKTALDLMGHETFVMDGLTKTIDPFITGGYAMSIDLRAPADTAPDTTEAIRKILAKRQATKAEKAEVATGEKKQTDRDDQLTRYHRRTKWSILCILTAPLGLFFGIKYLTLAAPLKPKPYTYCFHWFLMVLCLLLSLILIIPCLLSTFAFLYGILYPR